MEVLSLAQARRVALSAQGFGARAAMPRDSATARTGTPGLPAVRKVLRATRLLQMDSVNVFERAHYLPAFSRLGPYDRSSVDRLAYERRELFEYWGHEASLLPVALHPLLRWRMARAEALDEGWGGPLRVMRDRPELVAEVLRRVQDEGPVGAGALSDGPRGSGDWWDWDDTKVALRVYTTSLSVGTRATRADAPRLLITGPIICRSKNRPSSPAGGGVQLLPVRVACRHDPTALALACAARPPNPRPRGDQGGVSGTTSDRRPRRPAPQCQRDVVCSARPRGRSGARAPTPHQRLIRVRSAVRRAERDHDPVLGTPLWLWRGSSRRGPTRETSGSTQRLWAQGARPVAAAFEREEPALSTSSGATARGGRLRRRL